MFVAAKPVNKITWRKLRDGMRYVSNNVSLRVVTYYVENAVGYVIVENNSGVRYYIAFDMDSGERIRTRVVSNGRLAETAVSAAYFGMRVINGDLKWPEESKTTEFVPVEPGHQVADTHFEPWSVVFVGTDGNSVVLERAKDKKNILVRNTDKDAVKSFGLVWKKG